MNGKIVLITITKTQNVVDPYVMYGKSYDQFFIVTAFNMQLRVMSSFFFYTLRGNPPRQHYFYTHQMTLGFLFSYTQWILSSPTPRHLHPFSPFRRRRRWRSCSPWLGTSGHLPCSEDPPEYPRASPLFSVSTSAQC